MSEIFSVTTKITSADMDAALAFVRKRARKRSDAAEGVSAAMYSVMYATCNGLVECGLSIENVDSMLEQFRQQITHQLRMQQGINSGMN